MHFKATTDIVVKGRQEVHKQKLFKLSLNSIEFKLRYAGEQIVEIKEEIKELKEFLEDGDDDENKDTEIEVNKLQIELKNTRQRKKDLFDNWKSTTSSEESRRTLLDNEKDKKDNNSMSVIHSNESTHAVLSPITINDDCIPANLKHIISEIMEDVTNMNDVMNE